MIRLLMLLAAILLLFVGFYLLKKQEIFFVLVEKTEKNQKYLQFYGVAYALFGLLGLVVAFFNQRMLALLFLLLVIIISSAFSITFAKKMSSSKQ
jgi:dolichol kinase